MEEAATEYKKKRSVADLFHLQDFMHASNHDPINWDNLTHDHMTQDFWGPFETYMGKYAMNNKNIRFSDGNLLTSKKSVQIRKKTKAASFLNNSSQSCTNPKTDIFLEAFGPS